MADANSRRGKLYSCLHCEANERTYVEVRYRIIAHVYKHHLPLDKAPYYCKQCLFRCTTRSALVNHITKYSKHKRSVDDNSCLIENPRPAIPAQGTDFRELTEEECRKLVPAPEMVSDAESEAIGDGPAHQQLPNVVAAAPMQASNTGMISVQITPEMLSQLLASKSSPANPQTAFVPYSPAPVTNFPPYKPTPISTPAPQQTPLQPLQPYTPTSIHTVPSTPTPLLQKPLSLLEPMPQLTATKVPLNSPLVTVAPPARSTLDTPVLGSTYNIMDQLVGDNISELDYEFDDSLLDEDISKSKPTEVPVSRVDAGVQTETVLEPESKRRRTEDPVPVTPLADTVEQLVQGTLAQLLDSFEKNSRAIRGIDKTLAVMADAVVKMHRTLERMGEEQRRENERRESERRKEERLRDQSYDRERKSERSQDKKENKPPKSTVNKKK